MPSTEPPSLSATRRRTSFARPIRRGWHVGPRGGLRGRVAVPLFLALLFLLPLLGAGGARAAPAGAPTLNGAYIVGDGQALVLVGYLGFADVWNVAPNGSEVFSQAFYLVFFNLREVPVTLTYGVRQADGNSLNETVNLSAVSESSVTVSLPANTAWVATVLVFDGTPTWKGEVATPISLLPDYILNIGGLDLFALTLVSLMVLNIMAGVVLGRWAIRRAIWAPRFRMIIWGHVVLALLAGAVFLDYQIIDSLFAGWSPLVYPFFIFPMAFLWSLSLFNRARRVEIIEGNVTPSGEFGWYRTTLRIGRVGKRLAYVGESWGDMWARFWGHHSYCDDGDETKPRPWLAPVTNYLSPTASPRARLKAKKAAARGPQEGAAEALTRFPVLNDLGEDGIEFLAWGRGGAPVEPKFPRLSTHRTVEVPARFEPDPRGGAPVMVRAPTTRRKWAWPHYEDPSPNDPPLLEDVHFIPTAAAWAKFASLRDLGRVLARYMLAYEAETAHRETRIQDEVYESLRTHYALIGRPSSGIAEETAAARARSLGELVRPSRKEPRE